MKNITKLIVLFMIILFLVVFINRNNYYDNKNVISNEAIIRFEKDLKEGKEINPSNYITEKKDYNNKLSSTGLKLSHIIERTVNKILKRFLNYLEN